MCWIIVYIFCLGACLQIVTGEVVRVCRGESLDLECSPGHVLVIRTASYGRSSADYCDGGPGGEPCTNPGVVGKLADDCYRRRLCRLSAEDLDHMFWRVSLCTHRNPFLTVEYECVIESAFKSMCCGGSCEIPRVEGHGFVSSNNYPSQYEDNTICNLEIDVHGGQQFDVQIIDIDLDFTEETSSCRDSFVFAQDSGQRVSLCLPNNADDVRDLQNDESVSVVFESSTRSRNRGFLFEYQVLGCPLDLFPPRLHVGEIMSSTRDEVVYRCKPGYDGGDPERDVIILCVDNNWIEHNNRCIPAETTTSERSTASTQSPTTAHPETTHTIRETTPTTRETTSTTRGTTPTTRETTPTTRETTPTTRDTTPTTRVTSSTTRQPSTRIQESTAVIIETIPTIQTTTPSTQDTTPTQVQTTPTRVQTTPTQLESTPTTTNTIPSTVASTVRATRHSTASPTIHSSSHLPTVTTTPTTETTTQGSVTQQTLNSTGTANATDDIIIETTVLMTDRRTTDTQTVSTAGSPREVTTVGGALFAEPKKSSNSLLAVGAGLGVLAFCISTLIVVTVIVQTRKSSSDEKKKGDIGGITSLRPSHHAAAPIPSTYLGRPTAGSHGISRQYGSPYSTIGKASLIASRISEETDSNLIGSNDSAAHATFARYKNMAYLEEDDGEGSGSARYKSYNVPEPVGSMDYVSSDVIEQQAALPGSYVIQAEKDTHVRLSFPPDMVDSIPTIVNEEEATSEDTGNASEDNIDDTPAQPNRNSLPPDTLWDGDISESTDAYPHPVIPIPPPLPVDKAVIMQKAKSTGSILRPNREKKRLSKRRSKSSTRTSEVSDRECMDDELSDADCANSKRLIIRDSNNPTCSNIEVVPKQKKRKPYPYPLFKNDETGNLDNYLEDRRGSC